MLLTLLAALDTTDLLEVVKHLSMSPLDVDILLYDAIDNKEISLDKKKGKIKALVPPAPVHYNPVLAEKITKIIGYYDKQEANITRSRLEQDALNLNGSYGYPVHEFICTLYALEHGNAGGYPQIKRYEISVPKVKGQRPANTFVFYTLLDHQEFGAKAVSAFIDQWKKMSTKKK